MNKKLVITVSKGGAIKTAAEGFAGQGCEPLVTGLAAKLGGQKQGESHTDEYFQTPETEQTVTQ